VGFVVDKVEDLKSTGEAFLVVFVFPDPLDQVAPRKISASLNASITSII
jgi:hypothetical protein